MIYDIKAIPTKYGGTLFRSRLEARWAAFFDLIGIRWIYEPFELDGWTPDFMISLPEDAFREVEDTRLLVEVKPIDMQQFRNKFRVHMVGDDVRVRFESSEFAKAIRHWEKHPILLCGLSPMGGWKSGAPWGALSSWFVSCEDWQTVHDELFVWACGEDLKSGRVDRLWNEAGNRVRYKPR